MSIRPNSRSLRQRIAISTSSQIVAQITTSILGVVILKIITTNLGLSDYGIYATVFAFVTTFSLLTDLGLNAITAREIARHPEATSEIIGHNMGLRIVLCLIMIPVTFALSFVFYPGQSTQLHVGIIILSTFLIFDSIRSVALAYFTSQVRNNVAAAITTIQQIGFAGLVIIVSIFSKSIYPILGAYIAANAIGATLAVIAARKEVTVRPRINLSKWKTILTMSMSLGIIQVVNMLYLKADSIMLSVLKGTVEAGIYALAYSLILAFLALPSFIMTALIPSLATTGKDNVRIIVEKALQYMAILASLLAIGCYAVRNDIVVLAANGHFSGAAGPFAILAIASSFTYLNSVFGFASVSLNKHKKIIYVSLSALILNILLNLFLIPLYSISGAAWATVISEIVGLAGVYFIFQRETGIKIHIFAILLRPVSAGLITAIVVGIINTVFIAPNTAVHFIFASITTVLCYGLLLFLLKAIPSEIREIIQSRLPKL